MPAERPMLRLPTTRPDRGRGMGALGEPPRARLNSCMRRPTPINIRTRWTALP